MQHVAAVVAAAAGVDRSVPKFALNMNVEFGCIAPSIPTELRRRFA